MKNIKAVFISTALLAGCAKSSDRIAPVAFPPTAYSGWTCEQLNLERQTLEANEAGLSSAQNGAAIGDTIGVMLVGVPVSSLTGGDKETQLAITRGKLSAVRQAINQDGCPIKNPLLVE